MIDVKDGRGVWALLDVKGARAARDQAQRDYVQAMSAALDVGWSKNEVAEAAGITPSAVYKALRKVYGPRKITNEKER